MLCRCCGLHSLGINIFKTLANIKCPIILSLTVILRCFIFNLLPGKLYYILFEIFLCFCLVSFSLFFESKKNIFRLACCSYAMFYQQTFFACTFCFPNTEHVMILRRFDPLSCSLKIVHASMNMSACTFLMNKTKDQISWVSSHDLYWKNKMYKRKRSI